MPDPKVEEFELRRTYEQINADGASRLVVGDVNIHNVYNTLPSTANRFDPIEDGLNSVPGFVAYPRGGITADRENSTSSLTPSLFTVPYSRDDGFVDRKDVFDQIASQCSTGKPALLCGLGGTGKSQIAIEYAYRFRSDFPDSLVLWIFAATRTTIFQSFDDIAKQLKLAGSDAPESNCCQLVTDLIRKEASAKTSAHPNGRPWLLIVDNVDSVAMLELSLTIATDTISSQPTSLHTVLTDLSNCLSPCQQILLTSRNQDVAAAIVAGPSWVEIGRLSDAESLSLLNNRLPANLNSVQEGEGVKKLLNKLNHIPLAITHAAAFMSRSRISHTKYLEILEHDDQQLGEHLSMELQDPRRPRGWPNSVFETWKISYKEIQTAEPLAAKILSVMSMLNEKQIPRSLFASIANSTSIEVDNAIGTILSYSLASFEADTSMLDIHSLVSLSIREWLKEQKIYKENALLALKLLADEFPRYSTMYNRDLSEKYRTYLALAPHATTLTANELFTAAREFKLSSLLQKLAYWQNYQGFHTEALANARAALAVKKRIKQTERADTLSVYNLISRILINRDQCGQAEEIQEQAIATHRYALGDQHEEIIEAMGVLAVALSRQGMHIEATETCRQALRSCGKGRNAKDKQMLRILRIFGRVLKKQGDLHAAELMMRQAVDSYQTIFGQDNLDTIAAQEGVCDILLDQGKISEAVDMLRDVLQIRQRISGAGNLHTLIATWSLATALRRQHDHAEAIALFNQVLPGLRIALGEFHIEVEKCQFGLLETELEFENVKTVGPLPDRWSLLLDQHGQTLFEHQGTGIRTLTDPRFLTEDITRPDLGVWPSGWTMNLGAGGELFYVNHFTDEVLDCDPRQRRQTEATSSLHGESKSAPASQNLKNSSEQSSLNNSKGPTSASIEDFADLALDHSDTEDGPQQPLLKAKKWVQSLQKKDTGWSWTKSLFD